MKSSLHVEQVEEAAAAWLLKRESRQWSQADEAALREWLQASTSHRVTYLRLRSVWHEASRLKVVAPAFTSGTVPARGAIAQSSLLLRPSRMPEISDSPRHARSSVRFYGWAAGLLVAALGLTAHFFWSPGAVAYRTAIGGLAMVPMEDGSKITLNTNSEITLGTVDAERRVYLERGEAFFEVAKDPTRPFIVYANDQRVIAVGTKFAVRLKPESVQIAVTEGQVRLEKRAAVLTLPEPLDRRASTHRNSPLLTPGSIADAHARSVAIRQQPVSDIERSLSWRSGYVVLRKTLLGEAVAEFNRYNRRELVIDDPELAHIQVGGNFRSNNIDGFVRLLQEGFQIQAETQGDRIILSSSSAR